jgi:PAAR motif-containing protein
MGTPLFHVGAQAMCPHGGQVTTIPGSPRVTVGGQPVATLGDTYLITGCSFTLPSGKPQPCVKVQWLVPAARVKVGGQPVILQNSTGLCLSAEQIPQGPPSMVMTQMRAMGT